MRTVVLSDCHIGSPEANVAQLNRFLLTLECDKLMLAGDFFDLWDMSADKIRRQYAGTLDLVKKLLNKGTAIEYLLGNHDEDYLKTPVMAPDELPVVAEIKFTVPDGRRITIVHGHEFDFVYRKHHFLYKALAWANRTSAKITGLSLKSLGRRTCTDLEGAEYGKAIERIHGDARKAHAGKADVLIMGHTHSPEHLSNEGLVEFYNTGDWKIHNSYIVIEDDRISLRHLGCDTQKTWCK